MFDQIASRYDRINHILSLGIDRCWRRKASRMLAKYQPAAILDMACGTADSSISVSQSNKTAAVTGIDISSEMLQLGQEKISKKRLNRQISLIKGNAEQLQFENNTFDAVTIFFGYRNFSNRGNALDEIFRVLKDQGVLLIVEFSFPKNGLLKKLYAFYFSCLLPRLGGLLSGNANAYKYLVQSVKEFPGPHELCDALKSKGLRPIIHKPLTGGIASIYLFEKEA